MKSKRKLLIILMILLPASVFCTGVGIQLEAISPFSFYDFSLNKVSNYSYDYEFLCLGTMESDRFNLNFGTGMNLGRKNKEFFIGNSGYLDYAFFENQIKNNWTYNFGIGATYTVSFFQKQGVKYSFGQRIFAGMNWVLFDNYIELYFQQNVEHRFEFLNRERRKGLCLYFPTDIGIRWHF